MFASVLVHEHEICTHHISSMFSSHDPTYKASPRIERMLLSWHIPTRLVCHVLEGSAVPLPLHSSSLGTAGSAASPA